MRGFSAQKELGKNISRGGENRGARRKGPHIRHGLDELGSLDVVGGGAFAGKKRERGADSESKPSTGFGSARKSGMEYGSGWRASIHTLFDAHTATGENEHSAKSPDAPTSAAAWHLQIKEQQQVFGSWGSWQLAYSCLFVNTQNTDAVKLKHSEVKGAKSMDEIIRRGLLEVSSWKAREGIRAHVMHGRTSAPPTVTKTIRAIPSYISATVDVIESQLVDRQFMESGTVTASATVLCYASCLSRAVHTLTGSAITSGSYVDEETTYRSRASAIGLPEEVVELRRRVAHGGMPLLSEFRIGAALLLSYLHRQFWSSQLQQIRQLIKEEDQAITTLRRKSSIAVAAEEEADREVTLDDMQQLLADSSSEEGSEEEPQEEEDTAPVVNADGSQPLHASVGGKKTVEWCGFTAVVM